MASQTLFGIQPRFDAGVAVIFFASLLDYNIHRFYILKQKPEVAYSDKYKWSAENLTILKILIAFSLAGLVTTAFLVTTQTLYLLAALAFLTFVYSASYIKKQAIPFGLKQVLALKTILIAFVWTTATVLPVVFSTGLHSSFGQVSLIFTERFAFIVAIAIPFDIRDLNSDKLTGIRTIPVVFGQKKALQISNLFIFISLGTATAHYIHENALQVLVAYCASIISTFILINSKSLQTKPLYYHGMLDGCILLHGILICVSFFFST